MPPPDAPDALRFQRLGESSPVGTLRAALHDEAGGPGVGLGLAAVCGTVESHGGAVTVTSPAPVA